MDLWCDNSKPEKARPQVVHTTMEKASSGAHHDVEGLKWCTPRCRRPQVVHTTM